MLLNRLLCHDQCRLARDLRKKADDLRIQIPARYQRAHHEDRASQITQQAEDLPNREKYSVPIVHNGLYAYYREYDGNGHTVEQLSAQEKKRYIETEIAKNRSDANEIFKYTQMKRGKRIIFRTDFQYFDDNEQDEDVYDMLARSRGPPSCYSNETPQITTIGHATMLIQFPKEGLTVLTDPVFHHMQTVLYPRKTDPAWTESEMPAVDVIIISHNHRDHVDEPSLKQFVPHQPLLLVPLGDGPLMKQLGFNSVIEHDTWQRTTIQACSLSEDESSGTSISFVSVPANHWSCRGLFDANKSLFLGWVIHSEAEQSSFYFAGDTAELCEKDHRDIYMNESYAPVTVNMVPGGPNHQRDTMENTHASASYGIFTHLMHLEFRATRPHPFPSNVVPDLEGHSIGERVKQLESDKFCLTMFMHHNTFELGVDRFNEAEYVRADLLRALKGESVEYSFVTNTKEKITSLCERLKIDLSVSNNVEWVCDIVENVLNPKIGQSTTAIVNSTGQ